MKQPPLAFRPRSALELIPIRALSSVLVIQSYPKSFRILKMHLAAVLVQISYHIHRSKRHHKMQLKTILNRVTNYKSFVFGKIEIVESISGKWIQVEVQSRRNGQRICSGCNQVRPGYDTCKHPVDLILFQCGKWQWSSSTSCGGSIAQTVVFVSNRCLGRMGKVL